MYLSGYGKSLEEEDQRYCSIMKISIIIPVYNVKKYIKKAILSAMNQSYANTEIILIDDGSTDGSGEICDEYKEKDTRIAVIHQENRGLSAARNAGIDCATGDYLFFLDSDDYIAEDCLERMQQCAKQYQADIVYARHMKFEDGQSVSIQNEKNDFSISVVEKEQIIERLMRVGPWCDENVVISCNKLYHHRLFQNIRFPVGKIHEDEYIAHALYYASSCIVFLDATTYFYRVRSGSIMTEKKFHLQQFLDSFEFGNERVEFCKKYMPSLYAKSVRAYIDNMQVQYLLRGSLKEHKMMRCEITERIIKMQGALWKTQSVKYCLKTFFFLISPKGWKKKYWG